MKIEIMIYIYIAICISMIAFNIVYIFILRNKEKRLASDTEYFEDIISGQFEIIKEGNVVNERHLNLLYKKLKRTTMLTSFDRAMEKLYNKDFECAEKYIIQTFPAFSRLAGEYKKRNEIVLAYFPYIIGKYKILDNKDEKNLDILYELLRSNNVYCRENALMAIYSCGDPELVLNSLKIIDKNKSFHHPKLICDGLMSFNGNKELLTEILIEHFESFSVNMQLNILNFIRFQGIRYDKKMLEILTDNKENQELRFSAIRYFEKFFNEDAQPIIQSFARGDNSLPWQYQSIATSALKTYPCKATEDILKKNLSSSNWYIRLNSAKSCEYLGLTYTELIEIFDGNDRYAREILRYRLDRRQAEDMAVTK